MSLKSHQSQKRSGIMDTTIDTTLSLFHEMGHWEVSTTFRDYEWDYQNPEEIYFL